MIRWHLQKFDSGDFFEHVVFCYLGDRWKMDEFWRRSMDFISRSRRALLGCFQKSFHNSKVKNPKQPLAKIFQFFNFVPHRSNYNPPNFCALKMIFDRERAKTLKNSLFKILRQSPTLKNTWKLRIMTTISIVYRSLSVSSTFLALNLRTKKKTED